MTLPAKNILGNLSVLRDDFASAIEDQRDQIAFLGTLWEPATAYVHPCATIGSDGQRYYSMQSSTGQDPVADTVNAYWVLELEHESNANGEYWRWWDGLQICMTSVYSISGTGWVNTGRGYYYSPLAELPLPAQFINDEAYALIQNMDDQVSARSSWNSSISCNETQIYLRMSAIAISDTVLNVKVVAIGSWC